MRIAIFLISLLIIPIFLLFSQVASEQYYWSTGDKWSYKITYNNTQQVTRDFAISSITNYKGQNVFIATLNETNGEVTKIKVYFTMDLKEIRDEIESENVTTIIDYQPALIYVNIQGNQVRDWVSSSKAKVAVTFNQTTNYYNSDIYIKAKVLGTETVNVQAGTFLAYAIDFFRNVTVSYTYEGNNYYYTIIDQGKIWYSMEVKNYIKEQFKMKDYDSYSGSSTTTDYLSELISYQVKQVATSPTLTSPTLTISPTPTPSPTSPTLTQTTQTTGIFTLPKTSPTITMTTPTYQTSPQTQMSPIITASEFNILGLSMQNFILLVVGIIAAISAITLLYFKKFRKPPTQVPYPYQPPQPPPTQPYQLPSYQGTPAQYQQPQTYPQQQVPVSEPAQTYQQQPQQQPQTYPQQQVPTTKVCPYCNSVLPIEAKFCAVCGNPQPQ